MMPAMTKVLYINSFIYYIIMFICPFFFVNPCGKGMNSTSHIIYLLYSVMTFFFEIFSVLRIQKKIDNKDILEFNKWHFVELIMG